MDVDRTTDSAMPGGSLVSLVARDAPPEHHYMDRETLSWIASHAEDFPPAPRDPQCRIAPSVGRILGAAPIPAGWHAEPKTIHSVHGTRHLLRTAALAALLAEIHGLCGEDATALVTAASLHDCRRVHDNDDTGHGERASTWLIDHSTEVFSFFGIDHTVERVRKMAIAIRLHDIPYSAFTEADAADHSATEVVTDLLKTADALDRYRLPTLKWWPRYEYLRVEPPTWLRRAAFDLVVETETVCLDGLDSATAVLTTLSRLKLL